MAHTTALPATLATPERASFTRSQLLPVALGTLFLAAGSWIAVPMLPIDVNMQTYAVIVVGALFGARMGVLTVMAWLAEAAFLHHFFGPSAGYIVSFPVIAAFTGWLADRKLDTGILRSLTSMLAANAINLALGVFWLATILGWHNAILGGFMPFWIGGLLKAAMATATITVARKQNWKLFHRS
jgi:biotin transport system substrate-specific component